MNQPIQGSFYARELQKVAKDEQTQWRIEKNHQETESTRKTGSTCTLVRLAQEIRQLDSRNRCQKHLTSR